MNLDFPITFPEILTDRLELKAFEISDAEALFKLRSSDEFVKYIGIKAMSNVNQSKDMVINNIDSFKNQNGLSFKICLKGSNELIAYAGFWRIITEHYRAELGFGIDPIHSKKGYITEALYALLNYGFTELKLHSVLADVDPRNENSIRVLKKLGFKLEGQFKENFYFDGDFLDSDHYGLLEKNLSK